MRKTPISKANYLSRNGVISAEDTDTALPNVDKNKKDNQNKPQKPNKSFYQYMKNDQNLPNKNIHSNNSSVNHFQETQTTQEINHQITQVIEVDRPNEEIHEISHKIDIVDQIDKITSIETTIHDQIQTEQNFLIPVPSQILGIDTIQTIDHVIHHTVERETTQITEIEVIQTTEINVTKTIDQETIPTTDLIIKETITISIIGHETTHKKGIQITTIEEIILNPLIETIIVTLISNTNIEVTPKHQRQIN